VKRPRAQPFFVAFSVAFVALPLFMASQALAATPTPRQCVAANEASVKLSDEQKMRAAREQLLVCASPSCPKEVRAECTRQIDDINAHLPTVVFSVKTSLGEDVAAVRVTMDGELVTERLDGTALPLDPGSHEVVFEAPGQPKVARAFVFHDGDKARREMIVLGSPAAPAALGDAVDAGHAERVIGVVTGSVGVLGLVAGTLLGAFATSAWSTAKSDCPAEASCSAQAVSESRRASSFATGSTVALVAGGAVLATGVTVFLLAPKGTASRVSVVGSRGGLLVRGTF
jgi:hypothetical protein